MDESSQTNARNSLVSDEVRILAGYNDKQGSPAAAAEGSATGSSNTNDTNKSNEIIEVTEDSFEHDAPPELDDSDDDSAVEIVDAAAFREQQQQAAAAAAAATTNNNNNGGEDSDEELQCVGTANETKLPHNRQDCLTFRYNNNNTSNGTSCCAETTLENANFCQLCYCYVCDKPASECTSWYLGEKGAVHENGNGGPPEDTKQSSSKTDDTEEDTSLQQYNNHCNATDKGSAKNLWKNMRTAIKNGRDPSAVTANAAASNPDESLAQYLARYTVPGSATSTAASAAAALAEQLRQRQRERHRYRAHATGRGGAHQRRTAARDGGEENYSSIYGSVSMDAANAMDFSSTTTTSSRRSRAPRQERRTRPAGSNNEQRSRHSNHRDRMRTQAILEDLYS